MNQTSNIVTALEGQESNRPSPEFPSAQPCIDNGQEPVQNVCSESGTLAGMGARGRASIRRRWPRISVMVLLLTVLGCLFFFSLRLASTRIFQVDECVEVYVARLIATGAARTTPIGNFGLFELALSPLVGGGSRAIAALLSARLVTVDIFWLNILLITLASGEKLLSLRGVSVLFGAATLAPLWDYGFEIRHDNPLLTGLLVTWCAARLAPGALKSFGAMGFLAVLLQFVAFKAFVYTVPIFVFALLFLGSARAMPLYRLALAWGAGGLTALAVVRIVLGTSGLWTSYWTGSAITAEVATNNLRFGPGQALERLLTQTPLLLAVVFAALVSVAQLVIRKRTALAACLRASATGRFRDLRQSISSSEIAPEAILVLIALVALVINPTPFPYNLVNLVPFMYLLAIRYAARFADSIETRKALLAPVAGVLLFTHAVPFWVSTQRHLNWPNWRQETLMSKAEDLTDPFRDPVYDATGMVFTRPVVDVRAFIHSTNIKSLVEGSGPRVRDMLAANPAAVYLPNYRTDALAPEDHDFIRHHYVALADDFRVLGQVVEPGRQMFEIIHSGRYRISTLAGSDLAGTYPDDLRAVLAAEEEGTLNATLDGNALTNSVVNLLVGKHTLETAPGMKAAVVWVGPRVERLHRLPNRDHRFLFVNWY
jgi:hypothetical protein